MYIFLGEDSFVLKPPDKNANAGSTVNFTWLYQADSSDVLYVDIGFGREGVPIQYKYRLFTDDTFSILGDPKNAFADNVNITATVPISTSKGEVKVLINKVLLENDGYFACQVTQSFGTINDKVKLTVTGKHLFF